MSEQHRIPTNPLFQNLTGVRFGRLTVIEFRGRPGPNRKNFLWLCRCDCGNERVVIGCALRAGRSTSCGCRHAEMLGDSRRTHGRSRTSEYRSWTQLIQRCVNPNDRSWPHYGGRGIRVCDRWRESFENFIADMGPRPSRKHSIDRINNDGNYEPGNCRWATPHEQKMNRRNTTKLTVEGVTLTALEWSERSGISLQTIYGRVKHGWPPELAVTVTGNANATGWRQFRKGNRRSHA